MANLTRKEAIREACNIVGLAYHSINQYSEASDGFCDECPELAGPYQNAGEALAYVRAAVVAALRRDGFTLAKECARETD